MLGTVRFIYRPAPARISNVLYVHCKQFTCTVPRFLYICMVQLDTYTLPSLHRNNIGMSCSALKLGSEASSCGSSPSRGNRIGAFPFRLATCASELTIAPTASPPNSSPTISYNIPDKRKEEVGQETLRQKEVCDSYIASGLTWNVTVKFLMENLIKMGCPPPPRFIRCIDCGSTKAGGGFGILEETSTREYQPSVSSNVRESITQPQPQPCDSETKHLLHSQRHDDMYSSSRKLVPEIFLCQQHLVNEQHAHESLVHELIHAVDLCRYVIFPCSSFDFSIHAFSHFIIFRLEQTWIQSIIAYIWPVPRFEQKI